MKTELRGYKFVLHKAYFDKGYSLLNFFKYFIAFFGLASRDVKSTMIIGIFYAISCYIIGFLWFYFRMIEAEIEVKNQYDVFVKEMRKNNKIPH